MKIKVESEKIVKAVKKISGVDIILENPDDAREALDLVLSRSDPLEASEAGILRDIKVTSFQEYKTSAVDYKLVFLLEFLFEDNIPLERKVDLIKVLQEFFAKV
jgi:hypothetical protein